MPKKKRIDYSKFALAKTQPVRSPKFLEYVRTFPCSECKTTEDIQAHHLTIIKGNGGMSRKTDDNWCVPLCAICHHYLHWYGEQPYWDARELEPKIYAALLWDSFQKKGDVSTP